MTQTCEQLTVKSVHTLGDGSVPAETILLSTAYRFNRSAMKSTAWATNTKTRLFLKARSRTYIRKRILFLNGVIAIFRKCF